LHTLEKRMKSHIVSFMRQFVSSTKYNVSHLAYKVNTGIKKNSVRDKKVRKRLNKKMRLERPKEKSLLQV